jgi:hypothetical protein
MTPEQMLSRPVAQRRGAVTQETGGWYYLLIDQPSDAVLDALLAAGMIGAARRDCAAEVVAGEVRRPVGAWGVLVRLQGQRWTYVMDDDLRHEQPQQWAERFGWRTACFGFDTVQGCTIARLFEGTRCRLDFAYGLSVDPQRQAFHRSDLGWGGTRRHTSRATSTFVLRSGLIKSMA